jgi:hypothetical protein
MRARSRSGRIAGVLLATGALFLVVGLQPAGASEQAKPFRVKTTSTVKIEPTGIPGTAKYSGTLTCTPKSKGKGHDERARRRKLAKRCLHPERGRDVAVFHGAFQIGDTGTDKDGDWEVLGNKPPVGDVITVHVYESVESKAPHLACREFITTRLVPF